MIKLLVTGGSGYIGRNLIVHLNATVKTAIEMDEFTVRNEFEIDATFKSTTNKSGNTVSRGPMFSDPLNMSVKKWIYWDCNSYGQRIPDVDFSKYDVVLHLAMNRDPFNFPKNAEETYNIVVNSTFHMLQECKKQGVGKFIVMSSPDAIGYNLDVIEETTNTYNPTRFYDAAKGAMETIVNGFRIEGYKASIVRPFHPYGGAGSERFLVERLFRNVINNESIAIEEEEGILMNPVYITDLIEGLELVIKSNSSGTFNLAGPEVVSLRMLIQMFEDEVKEFAMVVENGKPIATNHTGIFRRAEMLLGYKPKIGLKEGIKMLHKEIK